MWNAFIKIYVLIVGYHRDEKSIEVIVNVETNPIGPISMNLKVINFFVSDLIAVWIVNNTKIMDKGMIVISKINPKIILCCYCFKDSNDNANHSIKICRHIKKKYFSDIL